MAAASKSELLNRILQIVQARPAVMVGLIAPESVGVAMFGLGLLLVLIWPSAMLYVLFLAAAYRIMRKDDQHWLAALMFIIVMLAGSATVASMFPFVRSIGDPLDHILAVPWQYWLYLYTLIMAGIAGVILVVSLLAKTFSGLVSAVRGG